MPQQTLNNAESGLAVRTKINANFTELYALVTGGGSTFDPKTIPALALWLDASDSSTLFDASVGGSNVTTQDAPVTRWKDKSGNNFDMIQSVENSKPVLKTAFINAKNCIRFDGINDFMSSGAKFNGYQLFTCFMVSKSTDTTVLSIGNMLGNLQGAALYANHGGYGGKFGNGVNHSTFGSPTNLPVLTSGAFKDKKYTVILNGQKGSTVSDTFFSSFLQPYPTEIGFIFRGGDGAPFGYTSSDYCEILIYGTEITAIQRQQIELYLNQKWAIFY